MKDLIKFLKHKRDLISLLIILFLLAALPAGIYLSQKTTIFKPKAFETNESVEVPEITKATSDIQSLSEPVLKTFACTKEGADNGSKRSNCTTPTGCNGNRLSRYHSFDADTNSYQCYWSAECIPLDPNCGYVDPTTPPSDNNSLKNLIYNEFKISFDDPFFNNSNNLVYLQQAWQILSQVKSNYPSFFSLLHRNYPVIYVRLDNEGYRWQDRIYFRRGGIVFNDENFFKQNLIHELGHVINGEPGQKIYNQRISEIIDKEGYLSSYAAGVTTNYQPICVNRPLNNNLRYPTQLDEEFAETIAYFLHPSTPELNYNNACPPKRTVAEGNPLKTAVYPQHFAFISNLLTGRADDTPLYIVPPGISYPDISSCKFTRDSLTRNPVKSSIPSNTLKSWISEVATRENVPVGVMGSVTMHENPRFILNTDDSHDAIKNNYYYIASRISEDPRHSNYNTNAVGLFQISTGKTPTRTGIVDHCRTLLQTGRLKRAADKLGKQIHDENYYCVDNFDERIRRFCQTDRVERNKMYFKSDKNYDETYINLCNLKDNIMVGAEFLNSTLGNGSWQNDQNLMSAVKGFYGDCPYPGGNYCSEVLEDKKACNPVTPVKQISQVFVGGLTIYGQGALDNPTLSLNKSLLCSESGEIKNVEVRFTDNTPILTLPLKFTSSNSSPACSVGALTIPKPEGLEYSCLDSDRAKVKWDKIQGTYQYALRVNNLSDGSWVGAECVNGKAPNDVCYNTGDNNALLIVSPGVNYDFWLHTYDPSRNELSDSSEHLPIVCGTPSSPTSTPAPISQPLSPPTLKAVSCGTNQATVSWDNVPGTRGYDLRADSSGITYSRNDCNNIHAVCVNGYSSNSITMSLSQNKQYRFWIHSVGTDGKSTPNFSETIINCPISASFTPINLTSSCDNNIVTLSWLGNSSKYALRLDKQTDNSWGPCGPGAPDDFCKDDITTNSYRFQIEPAVTYKWWIHGVGADGKYSDTSVNIPFSCPKTQVFSSIDDINTKIICSAGNQVLFYRPSADASSHEVRLDNLADGWTGCSSPAGDSCIKLNPNVTTIDNIQKNTTYRIWYHDVYSNGSYGIAKGDIRFRCE